MPASHSSPLRPATIPSNATRLLSTVHQSTRSTCSSAAIALAKEATRLKQSFFGASASGLEHTLSRGPLRALRAHFVRLPSEAKLLRRIRTGARAYALAPWGMQPNTSCDESLVLYHLSSDKVYYTIFVNPVVTNLAKRIFLVPPSKARRRVSGSGGESGMYGIMHGTKGIL